MQGKILRADGLLLTTAAIWGSAFVAQRVGMDYIGPYTFNAVRFLLGAVALFPLIIFLDKKEARSKTKKPNPSLYTVIWGGILTGVALFAGSSLQQVGLVYTTAGNAGFITGLYVVLVPILGLLLKQKSGSGTWIGAVLAVIGLYLLSISEGFTMGFGDLLVLIGAFFWASHVLIIGFFSPRMNPVKLAQLQFFVCSFLSFIVAFCMEEVHVAGIIQAGVPILYGGLMSVGVAYTLQVVAQRDADPAHAAIILSLESPFAALAGWLMLDETMGVRAMIGCGLMLTGMLISQLKN